MSVQELRRLWRSLDSRKRIIIGVATAAMFAAILTMAQIASRPTMALLYAELEPGAAGEVVRALEQRGAELEIRGDSIFVPEDQRDALRMSLAGEGLPANGAQGYELLDSLTGFGTTAQMFDAAYWRAKEGELARTIGSLSSVASARVHIARAVGTAFQRDTAPTASVFLTARTGEVEQGQARAMRFLVASAVPGLSPEDVSVIDNQGRLITNEATAASATIGNDRGDALRDKVQRLVEARVGKGNAVVEVTVDTVTETESILERRFDPEGRVAISTDSEETTNQSENGTNGAVTVASNMPDGDAVNGGGGSTRNTETRERINYEVSETTREVTRVPGAVKRLTVAVLVNGTYGIDDTGAQVFEPLPDTEIEALHALVSAAVGYDKSRGDEITLRSLPFDQPVLDGTTAIIRPWYEGLDITRLLQISVLALVALLVGVFVVRPVLTNAGPVAELPPPILPSMIDSPSDIQADSDFQSLSDLPMLVGDGGPNIASFDDNETLAEDPVAKLKGLIDSRQHESVDILRGWLGEKEEAKG